MHTLRVGFTGSRYWTTLDYEGRIVKLAEAIIAKCQTIYPEAQIEINLGDAPGVDTWLMRTFCEKYTTFVWGINGEYRSIDAMYTQEDYERFLPLDMLPRKVLAVDNTEPAAGYALRDRLMVNHVAVIYGLWNGYSAGTVHAIEYARLKKKRAHLLLITPEGWKVQQDV